MIGNLVTIRLLILSKSSKFIDFDEFEIWVNCVELIAGIINDWWTNPNKEPNKYGNATLGAIPSEYSDKF